MDKFFKIIKLIKERQHTDYVEIKNLYIIYGGSTRKLVEILTILILKALKNSMTSSRHSTTVHLRKRI